MKTAKQLAEETRAQLIKLTYLSPEYMYVLTDEPNAQGMTLASHGWDSGAEAELVADEAHDYLLRAVMAVPDSEGRWDFVSSAVLCFYEEVT